MLRKQNIFALGIVFGFGARKITQCPPIRLRTDFMQVRDLIEELKRFDPSAQVEVESNQEVKFFCDACGYDSDHDVSGEVTDLKMADARNVLRIFF